MPRSLVVLLSGLALFLAARAGSEPFLIADLNTTTPSSAEPAAFPGADSVELAGYLYFTADDGMHGRELWRTDGTGAGTEMVADICPGPCSSYPSDLTVYGDLVGFAATNGFHGREMWLSNGTRGGTRMPKDLCPGACSSISWGASPVTLGEHLFFVTRTLTRTQYRVGLAVTDGTAAGTRLLLETGSAIQPIGEIGGRLAFAGPGAAWSSALWWSDGTPEGTYPALDLCTGSPCQSSLDRAFVVGGRIVFFQSGEQGGIWASDGTPGGTRKIGDATAPAMPQGSVLWNGAVYFVTVDSLWRSDGTPEGTRKLRTFDPSSRPNSLLPFGDSLLFLAGDASTGPALWQTRGTPETTVLLSQPAPEAPTSFAGPLTRMGSRALFPVIRSGAADIWETDGSPGGTRRLTVVCGTASPRCTPTNFPLVFPKALGNRYLFALREETYGFELWTADAAGPRLVRDIRHNEESARALSFVELPEGEGPARDIAAVGTRLLFAARASQDEHATLWVSDGTPAGTVEIGPDIPTPNGFVAIGDQVWLRGSWFPWPNPYGAGLWVTSGTAAGTIRLAEDLTVEGLPGGRPGLVLVSGAGQDPADQQPTGFEPWGTDGTPAGTRMLKDLAPLNPPPQPGDTRGSSFPAHFAPLGNQVLFAATTEATGREPWITDGTEAGTRLLRDVNPRSAGAGGDPWNLSSGPGPFVQLGTRAWFPADDGLSGRELWTSDGTTDGTLLARDLVPGPAGSSPRDLRVHGNRLSFLADGGASDALWTVSAQGEIRRVRLLGNRRRASSLTAVGNRLYFVVDGPATGPELWTSDGTRPGTRLVREIRPGAQGSYPQDLTAVDGLLLFAANDGVHGLEPWVTDGTAAGTRLLADLAPGPAASGAAHFTVAGDLVGFDADDGLHGREMWAVRKADLRAPSPAR